MELENAAQVIDALGGNVEVAKLTDRSDSGVVWEWRRKNRMPPHAFLVMNAALKARGLKAPASLWGQIEPEQAA